MAYKRGTFKRINKDTIVYKKVRDRRSKKEYILEMLLPEGATYYGRKSGKCRADMMIPLTFYSISGMWNNSNIKCMVDKKMINHYGKYYHGIKYVVDEVIKPNKFSKRQQQCAGGIHFFFDVDEAIAY